LLPIIPFIIGAPAERKFTDDQHPIVAVKTEQIFDYSVDQVYDAIKSVDTLDANKPLLLKFDLPIPTRCTLDREDIGGIRTCYFINGKLSMNKFGSGTITERITQIERGKILRMDVIDCTIIGREWIRFEEAAYYFEKIGLSRCKLTRLTTYRSALSPRLFWEPFEKMAIKQEHQYVLNNLLKDLRNK